MQTVSVSNGKRKLNSIMGKNELPLCPLLKAPVDKNLVKRGAKLMKSKVNKKERRNGEESPYNSVGGV
jgi:hypothetical protein